MSGRNDQFALFVGFIGVRAIARYAMNTVVDSLPSKGRQSEMIALCWDAEDNRHALEDVIEEAAGICEVCRGAAIGRDRLVVAQVEATLRSCWRFARGDY